MTGNLRAPWAMLFARIILFFSLQTLFAFGFWLIGSTQAWNAGGSWWPLNVTLVNLICVFLLVNLFRREGKNYWELFRIDRVHIKSDALAMLVILIIAGPVAMLPNIWLATQLFGNSQAALDLLVRPLPTWAVYLFAILAFPITQGLAELATYFRYAMPRLISNGVPAWLALSLAAVMLGLQHLAIPFLFDPRFIAWRALMFIPFAFFVGGVLYWRPRLFPYIAVVHVLMDMAFGMMFLSVSQ